MYICRYILRTNFVEYGLNHLSSYDVYQTYDPTYEDMVILDIMRTAITRTDITVSRQSCHYNDLILTF